MIQRISEENTKYYRKLDTERDLLSNMDDVSAFKLTREGQWDYVDYYGSTLLDPSNSLKNPHYIYVLVNPSIPDICKIGYTRHNIYERVNQINSATGVITPWYPVFVYKCPNGPMLEKEIHNLLERNGTRINKKREGFIINPDEAQQIIEDLGKKYQEKVGL